jgi:ABC-type polysaccharide/polyol phosphate export permease
MTQQYSSNGMKEVPDIGRTEGFLCRDLSRSLRKPEFWSYSAWLEIVTKYRRSRLGIVWVLIPAALYMWGIGWFFHGHQGDLGSVVAHLGLGYLIFRLVMMVLNESASVAASQRAFILDGRTRLTDYVLRVLAKALFYFVMSLPVLLPAMFLGAHGGGWLLDTIAGAGFLLVLLNCVWMGALIVMAGARFPDVQEITASFYLIAFIFTPILWHSSDVQPGTFRAMVMQANPLYHMIEVVRAPLLGETVGRSSWIAMMLMAVLGWGVTALVYRRYARMIPIWI